MLYLATQILFCLALMAMVGILIGWLLRGVGTRQRERELEATWRMRLRQRDTMLSKMATELAERDGTSVARAPARGGVTDATQLADLRASLRENSLKVAQLQGQVSKRDAQISQLLAEIRRIGGQPAVDELLSKVNDDRFLASGIHAAASLKPTPQASPPRPASAAATTHQAPAPPPQQVETEDASEITHPEKASFSAAGRTAAPAPAAGDNDELKFIYGVSPALEKKLFRIGITSYRQIAGFRQSDVERVATALAIEPDQILNENWMESARQEHLAKYGELI